MSKHEPRKGGKPIRVVATAEQMARVKRRHKLAEVLMDNAHVEDRPYVIRTLLKEDNPSEAFGKMPKYLKDAIVRPVGKKRYRVISEPEVATAIAIHGLIGKDLISESKPGDRKYVSRILSREHDTLEAISKMPSYLRDKFKLERGF